MRTALSGLRPSLGRPLSTLRSARPRLRGIRARLSRVRHGLTRTRTCLSRLLPGLAWPWTGLRLARSRLRRVRTVLGARTGLPCSRPRPVPVRAGGCPAIARSCAKLPRGALPGMSSRPPGVITPDGFRTCSRPRWFRPLLACGPPLPGCTPGTGPAPARGPALAYAAPPRPAWLLGPAPLRAPAPAVAIAGRYCPALPRACAVCARAIPCPVMPPRSSTRMASTIMPNEKPATATSAPSPIVWV